MGTFQHATLPITISADGAAPARVQAAAYSPQGALTVAEAKTAGALYTVPAGTTFSGLLLVDAGGAGGVSVSAATGGALAGAGAGLCANQVVIAGGGSGNAVTVSGAPLSVLLVGYVD